MHLVLFGATGLVGSAALQAMLRRPDITKVTCVSRKPVPAASGQAKVEVLLHDDFERYDESLLAKLRDARGCVWALGISQTAVSKSEYVKITHDYTMAAARALQNNSSDAAGFNFVFVSGEGATHKPGLLTPIFGRCKGATELELLELAKQSSSNAFRVYSMRPAGVDPTQQPQILKHLPAPPAWRLSVLATIRTLFPGMHSPTQPLGEYLVQLAAGDNGGRPVTGVGVECDGWVIGNKAFRSQMEL